MASSNINPGCVQVARHNMAKHFLSRNEDLVQWEVFKMADHSNIGWKLVQYLKMYSSLKEACMLINSTSLIPRLSRLRISFGWFLVGAAVAYW